MENWGVVLLEPSEKPQGMHPNIRLLEDKDAVCGHFSPDPHRLRAVLGAWVLQVEAGPGEDAST